MSAPRRVLVLESQTPFVHGGAEILVRQLTGALVERGFEAEIVSLPFRDDPRPELMAHAAAWRLLNLSHSNSRPIDLVIATKFPTYFARHPRKVVWLVHQHRAAYELCGTPYSNFAHTEEDVGLRQKLIALDSETLGECVARYTIARTVTERLQKYNGLDAEPLYHPPKLVDRLRPGAYGDYMLCVTRLEHVKRVQLAIEAIAEAPGSRLMIAGDGSARRELEALIRDHDLGDRVTLLGRVSDDALIDLYAGARGLLFVPYAEDYGYVTLEAFLSGKPVVTASDSGGVLEFVTDGRNGFICDPTPDAIAAAVTRLTADALLAERLGRDGLALARTITWSGVVEKLTAPIDSLACGAARG